MRFGATLGVILLLASLATCAAPPASDKVLVVATIFPLADFARNVGGDRVEVTTLLPSGVNPETYEPTPDKVKSIAKAKLFVFNGAGLEVWVQKIVESAANPKLLVVETSQGLPLIKEEDEHEQKHHGVNPHVWLDPRLAQRQVAAIRDALIQLDPGHRDYYAGNATKYQAELEALDKEIREEVNSFSTKQFITFHAGWPYFAARYGLTLAAVIEEAPGKEPSPAYVKEVIDMARRVKAKAIFAEAQFNPKAAETIAAESGAQVLLLDPMGGPEVEGRNSYLKMMRYNLRQMSRALK